MIYLIRRYDKMNNSHVSFLRIINFAALLRRRTLRNPYKMADVARSWGTVAADSHCAEQRNVYLSCITMELGFPRLQMSPIFSFFLFSFSLFLFLLLRW